MSNTPPIDYQALPWARIREQYEKTDISLRMLARQWGLGSKNVIQRKIKAEGWVRRLGNIASHLALAQVAALEPDHELPIPRLPPRGRNGNGRDHPQKVAADTLRDEADVVTILTARTLAQMQTKRILRQLKVAEDIQEAGLSIVRCLIEVLKGDEAKVPQALERLLGVAPAGETMAGLLKAAAEAIDRGVVMERRALGMDLVNGVVPDAESTTDPAYTTGAAIEIVKKLDVSLGFRLREIATEVLEARRKRRAK